jgi:hypothetical protein
VADIDSAAWVLVGGRGLDKEMVMVFDRSSDAVTVRELPPADSEMVRLCHMLMDATERDADMEPLELLVPVPSMETDCSVVRLLPVVVFVGDGVSESADGVGNARIDGVRGVPLSERLRCWLGVRNVKVAEIVGMVLSLNECDDAFGDGDADLDGVTSIDGSGEYVRNVRVAVTVSSEVGDSAENEREVIFETDCDR